MLGAQITETFRDPIQVVHTLLLLPIVSPILSIIRDVKDILLFTNGFKRYIIQGNRESEYIGEKPEIEKKGLIEMYEFFSHSENKLKDLAAFNMILGCAGGVVALILFFITENWIFLVLIVLLIIAAYAQSLLIYAFSEMLEYLRQINSSLGIAFQDEISQREREMEETRRIAIEREEAERVNKERARLAQKTAEEAKQARVHAYWEEHKEEMIALRKKKALAESKLKKMSLLAVEERQQLQDLIAAIDEELTKDRVSR